MQKNKFQSKVLLVGWDAADWKAINPLMDAGLMPSLEKLVENGVMGNLTTLDPPYSPTLWTSISTGMRPYKHGIHGFTEPDPSGAGVRPSYVTSRKVKAIWNILMQNNFKCHQVAWWPSHPAEPINGVYISNLYQKSSKSIFEDWPLAPDSVHPKEKAEHFANIRVHPHELTAEHLLPFIPNAAQLDQSVYENQRRLNGLRSIISDAASIHSASTYIMEYEEWDFLAVYHDAIDHFGHGFMKFHPPKMEKVSQTDFEMWKDVVNAGYIYHDMMLGRLVDLAGEDCTIILVSDHGFHPDHLRPKMIPNEPAGPAAEHSPHGIVVISGPGIKKDEVIMGASILDVTPTILSICDLPIGEDMDGKVMVNAFETTPNIKTIKSWENVNGDCGLHPKDKLEDPYAAKEAMDQLVALGYIDPPSEDSAKDIKKAVDENNFNLGRAYADGDKYEEAVQIFKRLFEDNPQEYRYGFRLAHCYIILGETSLARHTVQQLRRMKKKPTASLLIMQARVVMNEKRYKKAIDYLNQALEISDAQEEVLSVLGNCYNKLGEWEMALKTYNKALSIDPKDSSSIGGKGLTLLRMGKNEEALEFFLDAISLNFQYPFAHHYLGETFYNLKMYPEAANAFEIACRLAPGLIKTREWLVKLYGGEFKNLEKLEEHKELLPSDKRPEILIVSGLPRSGTSMMMQMLEAGGIPAFTDGKRTADESNKKGYYEHEEIKKFNQRTVILADVKDHAVKIIAHFLKNLPDTYRYKIIFMERELEEILASQHQMLVRQGKVSQGAYPLRIAQNYRATLENVKNITHYQPNVEMIYINHHDVITNPLLQCNRIRDFLGKEMNTLSMAECMDVTLYNEKK